MICGLMHGQFCKYFMCVFENSVLLFAQENRLYTHAYSQDYYCDIQILYSIDHFNVFLIYCVLREVRQMSPCVHEDLLHSLYFYYFLLYIF